MSDPTDTPTSAPSISEERFAALPPEVRRRVGTAMQLLLDVKKLHVSGLQVAADMLGGKISPDELGQRLLDFERDLRIASHTMLKRPLRVTHAEAVRTSETKHDESAWLKRVQIKASEAREARENEAREERSRALTATLARAKADDEPEPEAGPRP